MKQELSPKIGRSTIMSIVIRYGLNTGQIVEVNAVEYTDTVEAMENIQWAMEDEKFVEHKNAMVLCKSIISVEVFEK